MITAPLAVILGVVAFSLVKTKSSTIWASIANILFGIALASTVVGPPMINGLESGSNAVFQSVGDAVKAGH